MGEAMSYLGDYTKATVSAAKIFKLIYNVPAIDANSSDGLKEVRLFCSYFIMVQCSDYRLSPLS